MVAPKLYQEHILYGHFSIPNVRPMIVHLMLMEIPHSLIGVEVGVFRGDNAVSILNSLNMGLLYLVDPYVDYLQDTDLIPIGNARQEASRLLEPYADKIKQIFMPSDLAASEIPSGLDFVYIDGNHYYPYVKKDIECYYPKVRLGGLVGGHDFDFPGVRRAVCEFATTTSESLLQRKGDWWIVKGGTEELRPM
jgi:hypothetical protein